MSGRGCVRKGLCAQALPLTRTAGLCAHHLGLRACVRSSFRTGVPRSLGTAHRTIYGDERRPTTPASLAVAPPAAPFPVNAYGQVRRLHDFGRLISHPLTLPPGRDPGPAQHRPAQHGGAELCRSETRTASAAASVVRPDFLTVCVSQSIPFKRGVRCVYGAEHRISPPPASGFIECDVCNSSGPAAWSGARLCVCRGS